MTPMIWWDYFAVVFVYSGTVFALFLLVSEFMKPKEKRSSLWQAAVALASIQFHNAVILDGTLAQKPFLLLGFLSSVSVMGPLIYRMACNISSEPGKPVSISRWNYALPAMVLVFEIVFLFGRNPFQREATDPFRYPPSVQLMIAIAPVIATFAGYVIAAGLHVWRINREYTVRYNGLSAAIFFTALSVTAGTGPGFLWGSRPFFLAGSVLFTVMVMMILFFAIHYPGFFESVRREIHKQRYERTALNGIDLSDIHERLHELFVEEQIFRDETLRLIDVARELGISTNQLSRILNERYSKNFYQYVNGYRLTEAARILIEETDKKILTIAHEVGFQSKSTFNARFLAEHGMVPSAYRNKYMSTGRSA